MEDAYDFLRIFNVKKDEKEVKMMAPLVLAYIGDAVYEMYIRSYIVSNVQGSVNQLHKISTKYVKAKSQAYIIHKLEKYLKEDEWNIVKRGRNQKSATVPKHAELIDYKYATGFESLIGYLFLVGNVSRLNELMLKSIEIINKEKDGKP